MKQQLLISYLKKKFVFFCRIFDFECSFFRFLIASCSSIFLAVRKQKLIIEGKMAIKIAK